MNAPALVRAGEGEVVGDTADRRVEILSDDESLHATWSRFGPHREGADLHVHECHTDLFYVLEGELTVRLGAEDDSVVAPPGALALVPPMVVHGFRNGTDTELRYLNFHAPGRGFAEYLRALRDGRSFAFDQYPPPAHGARSKSDAVVGRAAAPVQLGGLVAMLLADVEEIAVAEMLGQPAEPAHVHRRHVESLYVLEGALAVTSHGRELQAEAGSWVQIPIGMPHAVAGSQDGRFLAIHSPSCGFGSYLRGDRGAFDEAPA